MSRKSLIWIGMTVGGTVGGYLPVLWGDSYFSFMSVLLTAVGSLAGVYAGFRLANYF